MDAMHEFRQLKIWKMSIDTAVRLYAAAERLPARESFGIRTQIERAAASIGANIAEGRLRPSEKDFCRFLSYAVGSTAELEHFLELSVRLGHLPAEVLPEEIPRLQQLRSAITGLIRTIQADS
jgi:four helix bundle protein